MSIIKGICITPNIHDRREFPKKFVTRPLIGEYVQADDGTWMRIKNIVHTNIRIRQRDDYGNYSNISAPRIKLILEEP